MILNVFGIFRNFRSLAAFRFPRSYCIQSDNRGPAF